MYGLFPQHPQKLGEPTFPRHGAAQQRGGDPGTLQPVPLPRAPTPDPHPPTHSLPPHSQNPLRRLNPHVRFCLRVEDPHMNHFYPSQGEIHVQMLRGEMSLPQFGGLPAPCPAWLVSSFTSTFL